MKSPSVQIIDRIVDERYSPRIDGHAMKRNFCQPDAPSTDAASYCSPGIARRPATRISVQNGSDFHTCMTIENVSARAGSFSQFGPSAPVSRKMVLLITPHSGLSMKRTDRIVGIDGTAHGRMNSTERILIHQRSFTKKPESTSAITILMLIATTRKISVLTAVRKKIGSLTSAT